MSAHVIIESIQDGADTVSSQNTPAATDGSLVSVTVSVATGETDKAVAFALDVGQCRSFYMVSDQDVTIETNAVDAAGGNTLALKANIPYVWYTNKYDTFKFTADIAVMYVTNSSGSTAAIKIRALYDATP